MEVAGPGGQYLGGSTIGPEVEVSCLTVLHRKGLSVADYAGPCTVRSVQAETSGSLMGPK